MKQSTIKIEGFVTVTHKEDTNPEDLVLYLQPMPNSNMDVVENVITEKTVTNTTDIG